MSKRKETPWLLSEKVLRKYLKGKFAPKKAHELERKALNSPLEGDALDGWEANDPELLAADLDILRTKLAARRNKGSGLWLRVAAIGLLLVTSAYVLWFLTDKVNSEEKITMKSEEVQKDTVQKTAPSASNEVSTPEETEEVTLLDEASPFEKAEPTEEEQKAVSKPETAKPKETITKQPKETIALAEMPDSKSAVTNDVDFMLAEEAIVPKPEVAQALSGKLAGVQVDQSKDESPVIQIRGTSSMATSRSAEKSTSPKERILVGKVTSAEDGEPLPGVTLFIKGTDRGTLTNIDGNYQLNLLPEDKVLVFSFVGFTTYESKIGTNDTMDIALHNDMMALEEVVVVGYGVQRKKDMTGAVSTVNMDEPPVSYQNAEPEGGMRAFKTYLDYAKVYPKKAGENGIKGTVKLSVNISASGQILDVKVKDGLGYGCDEEAIRLIKEGPKWKAAKRGDQSVESEETVKIKFP